MFHSRKAKKRLAQVSYSEAPAGPQNSNGNGAAEEAVEAVEQEAQSNAI